MPRPPPHFIKPGLLPTATNLNLPTAAKIPQFSQNHPSATGNATLRTDSNHDANKFTKYRALTGEKDGVHRSKTPKTAFYSPRIHASAKIRRKSKIFERFNGSRNSIVTPGFRATKSFFKKKQTLKTLL